MVVAITFQYILFIFVIVANLALGATILLQKRKALANWLYAITVIGVSLWAVGDMLLLGARSEELVRIGAYLFYIAPLIIPVALWLFTLVFPERSHGILPRVIIGAVSFVAVSLLIYINLEWLIQDITITDSTNISTPHVPGFLVYSAYLIIFFNLTYMSLLNSYRRLRGVARQQLTYVMFGAVFASVPALFTNLFLPLVGVKHLIWLGPVFSLFAFYTVAVAMVKHKLFDIRALVARTLTYFISLVILAVAYGFLVYYAATYVFAIDISLQVQVFIAISASGFALLLPYLTKYFNRATKKVFYPDAYDSQQLFDELNKALLSNVNIHDLSKAAVTVVAKHLKIEHAAVVLLPTIYEEQRTITINQMGHRVDYARVTQNGLLKGCWIMLATESGEVDDTALHKLLSDNNIGIIIKLTPALKKDERAIGYLILGNKSTDNMYSKKDTELLRIIASELVIAMQNALRFEEIEKFNFTLQQKIDEATRELQKTNEKLRALDEAKDDFISMASHQLRTPLTSIKGYVSMILEGDAGEINEQQRRFLSQAFTSSQRMVYLIADLLNVSRLKTGKFVIESVTTYLPDVVETEIGQLYETAAARGLDLRFEKPSTFTSLNLDETKIRQVIMNFADNAIYYTPRGGYIEIKLSETESAVEFTVTDTGIGVPKSEQHHLFTKFYRAGNARRARPDGTGLGLFMAKKVIVAQGGSIIFRSEEGKGSTFGFTLPKAKLLPKDLIY